MLLATSSPGTAYGSKMILRPESHRHGLLYERSALLALPRRNETGAPAAHAVWKTAMRAATSMMLDWWLNSVSRRTLLGFSEALICLSYSALEWSLREVTLPGLSVIG